MPDGRKTIVKLDQINKIFGVSHVVKNINMEVYEGEFLTVLGSSGCGKTTILRMIGGFETPTSGSIYIEGEDVEGKAPYERNVNTVFQSYALFPHMNVYDNIAYGLKFGKKADKKEIYQKVMEMLDLVQLSGFEKRQISQLSGGQKQRIAIARALINQPKVLLLDEPLGALDLQLRKQMQVELKRLQKKLGITFIYVTHDQEEALTMSDRIAVMNAGNLEQMSTPKEIYEKPKTKFVADFIGEANTFNAQATEVEGSVATVIFEEGRGLVEGKEVSMNELVYISIRPENMKYSYSPISGFSVFGVVKEYLYNGTVHKCIISLTNGHDIKLNSQSEKQMPKVGEGIYLYWNIKDAVIIHSIDDEIYKTIDNIRFD
ncbi:MAG: ABC transporter ATP-binding protein [Candidatus Metalachnospira sp.]|nr:ABC transporter ATP-binding protein [Candidatus Metalachnospira sp.]